MLREYDASIYISRDHCYVTYVTCYPLFSYHPTKLTLPNSCEKLAKTCLEVSGCANRLIRRYHGLCSILQILSTEKDARLMSVKSGGRGRTSCHPSTFFIGANNAHIAQHRETRDLCGFVYVKNILILSQLEMPWSPGGIFYSVSKVSNFL